MSNEKELLEVAIYQCGKLTPNEEDRLYKWIESLEVAKRKADEYEAKAKAWDELYGRVKKVEKEVFGTGKPIVPQKDAFARLGIVVSDFIYDEYESGGYDAKK